MLGQEGGLSLTIAQIVQRLKASGLHSQLERQARLSLQRPEIKLESLKEDIKGFLKTSGWEKKLQNAVYSELSVFPSPCHPSAPPEHIKESLAYMRKAQGNWEKRILKSLNSMCTELGIPLAQKRSINEQKELLSKWNEMGTDEPDLSLFRPVYAPKDFLEVLMNLRSPNYETSEPPSFRNHLGLIQVPLKVKDIPELKEYFSELDLNTGQLDIDDSAQVPPELFENEHGRIGQKVLTEQDSAAAQQYIRQGCPNSLRAELWPMPTIDTDALVIVERQGNVAMFLTTHNQSCPALALANVAFPDLQGILMSGTVLLEIGTDIPYIDPNHPVGLECLHRPQSPGRQSLLVHIHRPMGTSTSRLHRLNLRYRNPRCVNTDSATDVNGPPASDQDLPDDKCQQARKLQYPQGVLLTAHTRLVVSTAEEAFTFLPLVHERCVAVLTDNITALSY
ncbi:PREDICTED: TBC1 domain family member 19-like, partial [Gekko japonicus]|uniref:TBC1 domain family member 19-like n=1 Tax=Gekko japonicus TaxID=146911 RepID=A0ABM1JHV6_GEKJA